MKQVWVKSVQLRAQIYPMEYRSFYREGSRSHPINFKSKTLSCLAFPLRNLTLKITSLDKVLAFLISKY